MHSQTIKAVLPPEFGEGWMSSSARDLCKIVAAVFPEYVTAERLVVTISRVQKGSGKVNVATVEKALSVIQSEIESSVSRSDGGK